MYDDSELDRVEHYLSSAPVLDVAAWGRHGAHRSFRFILRGGIGVLVKPEDTINDGPRLVRREVAAWVLARELGWPEIMSVTALRAVESPDTGAEVQASVQVLWPDVQPDADAGGFSDEDTTRAAVFDFVVGHSDRGGHNWLALPGGGHPPQLKLIDHGYAFPDGIDAPNSTFFVMHEGDQLAEETIRTLGRLDDPRMGLALAGLLTQSEMAAVHERAQHLRNYRILGI